MRNIRLQLKTGYMRKAPGTYLFMQRYPPLSRDTSAPVRDVMAKEVPFANLYDKLMNNNPIYNDDKVYPAYGAHETKALKIAMEQHKFMTEGLGEEEALRKANELVDALENNAFIQMTDLQQALSVDTNVRPTMLSNPEVTEFIAKWKAKLDAGKYSKRYEDLPLEDQGLIDCFIHTKILRWNEVERERRMKDPVFVNYFEKLRYNLLHNHAWENRPRGADHRSYTNKLKRFWSIPHHNAPDSLSTLNPFYYEDYKHYFDLLRETPLLARWEPSARMQFSHWIIECLALKRVLKKSEPRFVQHYLDQMRAQFFPMVRYPTRAAEFVLPSYDEFRRVLYNADIGFKREEGKLYVRRFYRIPQLFFPKETLTTSLTADHEKLKEVLDAGTLESEILKAGVGGENLSALEQELREYMTNRQPNTLEFSNDGAMTMNELDALLRDDDDLDLGKSAPNAKENAAAAAKTAEESLAKGAVVEPLSEREQDPVKWQKLIERYVPAPTTELAQIRHDELRKILVWSWDDCLTEQDLKSTHRDLVDSQLLAKARLSTIYDQKETARRTKEWKDRKMMLNELPTVELQVVDNRE